MPDPNDPSQVQPSPESVQNEVRENDESRALIDHAFLLGRALGINALLVQADEVYDVHSVNKVRREERIIWLARSGEALPLETEPEDAVVAIPDTQLARMNVIMFGLFMALLDGKIDRDASIVCLSGVAGSKRLDTLLIANPSRDFPWFQRRDLEYARQVIPTRVFAHVLTIALRFAAEGREGKPIGTIFVLGEIDAIQPHLRQLILNPMQGHPQKLRSVFDEDFVESLRELSAMDGAMVINNKGVAETAGTYIDAPTARIQLPPGLGARHAAAAAITAATEAIAITVSESSGSVRVFHGGEVMLRFEKPGAVATARQELPAEPRPEPRRKKKPAKRT